MKKKIQLPAFKVVSAAIILIVCLTSLTTCKTLKSISERFDNRMAEAIQSMDYAIDVLAQESSN